MAKIINGISRKMTHENIKEYLTHFLDYDNFKALAYVYALNMAEKETQEEISRARFLAGSEAANYFGRAISVMLFKALTKYGAINKRFVALLNEVRSEYAGARGNATYVPIADAPLGWGALSEDLTLPNTGATGIVTEKERAEFDLFIKMHDFLQQQEAQLPEFTEPSARPAILANALATSRAKKYLDKLQAKIPWIDNVGQTYRRLIQTDFRNANFRREYPNTGLRSSGAGGRAGHPMLDTNTTDFAFNPRAAPAGGGGGAAPVPAGDGGASAGAGGGVATAGTGGGGGAAAAASNSNSNSENSNSDNSNSEEEPAAAPPPPAPAARRRGAAAPAAPAASAARRRAAPQEGGRRTKKRKYHRVTKKKSQKNRKQKKTRSRRSRH